ncbi:RipA family octameric membrane protein [Erwinia sp. SLM-02]|uniref:RipA family octameric membrane protein n=1 Tax=Erwinia sp. SLM-02 TaxID=3020057 RepID=UPI0030A1E487
MKVVTEQADAEFMQAFFENDTAGSEHDERRTVKIQQALIAAVAQKNRESTLFWQHAIAFLALFVFLYAALGASLTLDLSAGNASHGHKSIEYALEAIPVLIAFSGYFIAILYLFHCKTSARRTESWDRAIRALEAQGSGSLFTAVNARSSGASDYSSPAIATALALFIGLTWLVIYNYLTFTTSGVMGSVISLFISTMTYVILDIQLLKPTHNHAAPAEPEKEEEKEKAEETRTPPEQD